jgi:hypothetical protein
VIIIVLILFFMFLLVFLIVLVEISLRGKVTCVLDCEDLFAWSLV